MAQHVALQSGLPQGTRHPLVWSLTDRTMEGAETDCVAPMATDGRTAEPHMAVWSLWWGWGFM